MFLEPLIGNLIDAVRRVLVPTYLGLSLALLVLGMKGFHEAFPVLLSILSIKGSELVLVAPALIT